MNRIPAVDRPGRAGIVGLQKVAVTVLFREKHLFDTELRRSGRVRQSHKEAAMQTTAIAFFLFLAFSTSAVSAQQDGSIEGALEPPDAPVQISASRDGSTIVTTRPEAPAGKFKLSLPAGTYTIMVSSPVSSFPIRLENITVNPGATTVLPTLLIMAGSGRAVLSGRVLPQQPDSEVALYFEGKERAAARTDREGRYEFRELPAGEYEVRASAPGHVQDRAPITIPENQRVQQTSVLLPIVATDGVDWAAGKIRATGTGDRPQNAENPAQARAMAQRAAIADGQRNLLRVVEQIKVDGQRSVRTIMNTRNGVERIQGFIKGSTVVSEQQLADGRVQVIMELPLTGPRGLSRYLAE